MQPAPAVKRRSDCTSSRVIKNESFLKEFHYETKNEAQASAK